MDKKADCQKEIEIKWQGGKQVIDGITYDAEDPDTRLIGYSPGVAHYIGEQIPPQKRLYYNMRDVKYFMHIHTKDGKIETVHTADARHYMDHDGFDQCVSEEEIERIKKSDGFDKR